MRQVRKGMVDDDIRLARLESAGCPGAIRYIPGVSRGRYPGPWVADILESEFDMVTSEIPPGTHATSQGHFWGGSPIYLNPRATDFRWMISFSPQRAQCGSEKVAHAVEYERGCRVHNY